MIKNKETNEIFSVQIHFQRGKTAFKSRSSIVWWHVMKDFLNLDYPSTGNVEAESCDLDNELSIQSDNVQSFVTIKNRRWQANFGRSVPYTLGLFHRPIDL